MLRTLLVIGAFAAATTLAACDTSSGSAEPAMQPKPNEQRTNTPQVPAPPAR